MEDEKHHSFVEISREYGYDCGITVCGEYDEDGEFQMEYYHPYFNGGQITTYEAVSVERHAARESFAGGCDDLRLGITLIFYLINAADYLNSRKEPGELKKSAAAETFRAGAGRDDSSAGAEGSGKSCEGERFLAAEEFTARCGQRRG